MKIYLSIILTAILTNNYILSKFLGICPFLGVSKKTKYSRRYEPCGNFRNGHLFGGYLPV